MSILIIKHVHVSCLIKLFLICVLQRDQKNTIEYSYKILFLTVVNVIINYN